MIASRRSIITPRRWSWRGIKTTRWWRAITTGRGALRRLIVAGRRIGPGRHFSPSSVSLPATSSKVLESVVGRLRLGYTRYLIDVTLNVMLSLHTITVGFGGLGFGLSAFTGRSNIFVVSYSLFGESADNRRLAMAE